MLHSDIASIADSKKAAAFDSSTSTRNGLTGTYILRNRSAIPFAAFDPLVAPSSLLLLQALLPEPPASWKKHALPSLARQVRKLRVTS